MGSIVKKKEERAKLKVERLKGFYTHVIIYVIINVLLLLVKLIGTYIYGEYFMGPLWHFSTFMGPLFWGIGLAIHGFRTFAFGQNWEERQISKYMNDNFIDEETYS